MEVPLTHMIAAEQELALVPVPYRKREIADEVFNAQVAPLRVRAQEQGTVRKSGKFRRIDVERSCKIVPVVETEIRNKDDSAVERLNRLFVEGVLMRDAEQSAPHSDRALAPEGALIRAAMRERLQLSL
jgi:hypothetical protein